MKITIDGRVVTREVKEPTPEEITLVMNTIKAKYGLGWSGVACIFGMKPNAGSAMNIKHWCAGRRQIPYIHWVTAKLILDEYKIEILEV
ncbi:hypothetical protein PE36_00250 [Moritella sp. PE36]|uniref:hypothetical protein n=1 Tax=Moritella sp. PE36 TaxID=58051 RepID=UPI00015693CE|nr:hypothetical protein [Moritella sp. PE36]EDM66181.1 hypothetical protein PE36_00250 [Moritella sp. PE36]